MGNSLILITNKISTWIIMSIFRTSILMMVIMMSSLENQVEAGIVSDVLSWIGLGGAEGQEKTISENDENVVTEDETAEQINEEGDPENVEDSQEESAEVADVEEEETTDRQGDEL